jgi:hypothetical protein
MLRHRRFEWSIDLLEQQASGGDHQGVSVTAPAKRLA